MHLLRAESPGPDVGKLVPRMRHTALILYLVYIALTLLTAGYDVATCRLCPGSHAQATFNQEAEEGQTPGSLVLRAKYPGTFGNNLWNCFK
jgi:hypothetical protein